MSVVRRLLGALAVPILASGLLAGCGGNNDPTGAGSAQPSVAPDPPKPPAVSACYNLTVAAALKETASSAAVPCDSRHTSLTVAVGTFDPLRAGHLLAIGSAQVQQQIAAACRRQVDTYVGGSTENQRLSQVQAVWYSPTAAQGDAGALWYRCDLVISAGGTGADGGFVALPTRTRRLLEPHGALDRYGTCGTAAPGAPGFGRVPCAEHHTWRAKATIALPASTRYLAKPAGSKAESACRDVASQRAPDILKLRWTFEWPTQAQWAGGQRYGLCWLPDKG
ncbi:MAG TPA: septum formation family protein [Marmoricola sp.]|nr:septum formation family protein [Marmoricola sp.]